MADGLSLDGREGRVRPVAKRRNEETIAAAALLERESEALIRGAIELALPGHRNR